MSHPIEDLSYDQILAALHEAMRTVSHGNKRVIKAFIHMIGKRQREEEEVEREMEEHPIEEGLDSEAADDPVAEEAGTE